MSQENNNYAIRFGLGAIKAVGIGIMENVVLERNENGKFIDIYDFAKRVDPKSVNKKSIEALSKAGAFDVFQENRRQLAESFDIITAYSAEKSQEAASNQMSLFAGLPEADAKPPLKNVENWHKDEKLQKEFEAFGYFLNEHPLDDKISDLRKRGTIFSDKIERDELEDGNIVRMAGVIASSKHRSGPKGRFAYVTISDPYGIFEAMIFDENLITNARDILSDGSIVSIECYIRKDDGGTRILIRSVISLEEFIANVSAQNADFEDIKKQKRNNKNFTGKNNSNYISKEYKPNVSSSTPPTLQKTSDTITETRKIFSQVEIFIKDREVILTIKSMLSQLLAPLDSKKNSTVFLCVVIAGKISKIELPNKYLIDESNIIKFRRLEKIIDVKII